MDEEWNGDGLGAPKNFLSIPKMVCLSSVERVNIFPLVVSHCPDFNFTWISTAS